MTYAWIYQDLQSCITSALQSIQSKQLWAQWRHLFSSPPVWQEASNLVQTAVSYFSSAAPLNPPPIPSFSLSSISTPSIQTSSPPPLCMGAAEPTWYPDFIHTHTHKRTHKCTHRKGGGIEITYDWSLLVLDVGGDLIGSCPAHTIPLLQKCAVLPIQYTLWL